ncbi:MAG: S1C family serine protease [Rhizobiaceae bacterium]|nr:S1C family serine protease [Rhizobiaceae bacterium]
MTKSFLMVALLTASLQTIAQTPNVTTTSLESLSGRDLHRKVQASVVMVEARGAAGMRQGSAVAFRNGCAPARPGSSGRCIPSSTWLFTNAHVVQDALEVLIKDGGQEFKARVRYLDPDEDLAVLFADTLTLPPLETASRSSLQVGDKVFAVGAPQGLERSLSEGIVSGIRGEKLIQTTAAISPGSSGGGLFDSRGRLVGITTFRLQRSEGLNFAISLDGQEQLAKARLAAQLVGIQFNIDFRSASGLHLYSSLAKWLTGRDSSGRLRFEVLNKSEEEFLTGKISAEAHEADIRSLWSQFTQALPQQTTAPSPQSALIRLICDMRLSDGKPLGIYTFVVDVAARKVSGLPAEITDDSISFEISGAAGSGNTVSIDRNSGLAVIGSREYPRQAHGPCKRSEGRAF